MPPPTPKPLTPFERAVEVTLSYEGEESNHPKDPGGLTRFGIAQRWHPGVKVAELTRAEAVELLERLYWFPIRGDLLPWPLGLAVFDHAVHSGPGQAIWALQKAVGADPDRLLGPKTRAALAGAWEVSPRAVLALTEALRSRELAAEPHAPTFLGGWLIRLADLGILCGYELGWTARLRAA